MGKVWVLDTETKGTGAQMVPLEKVLEKPESRTKPATPRRPRRQAQAAKPRGKRQAAVPQADWSTPLPPGHVRKKATGEIGRVKSVDPKAGTARVLWLKRGRSSTVPLTAISRR